MSKLDAIVDRHSYEQLNALGMKLAGADNETIERETDRLYPCGVAQVFQECLIRGVDVTEADINEWAADPANCIVRTGSVTAWYARDVDKFIVAMVEADKLMPQAIERHNAGVTGADFAAAWAAQQIKRKHAEYAARN